MRVLVIVLAIAAAATSAASKLFVLKASWGAPLAILLAGGGVIAIGFVLRNAPRPRLPRRRGRLPNDPGIPRPPLGAPFRGPY